MFKINFSIFKGKFGLVLGAIATSFASIIVKKVEAHPTMTGFWRCLFGWGMLVLIASFYPKKKGSAPVSNRYRILCVLAGIFFSLDLFFWHKSILSIGAGIATVLINCSAIFLAIIGILFLKEKVARIFYLVLPMAIIGLALLVGIQNQLSWSEGYYWGVISGLVGAFAYALFIVALRDAESTGTSFGLSAVHTIRNSTFVSATALFIYGTFEGVVQTPTFTDFWWFLLLAFLVQAVGWLLITTSLPQTKVATAGLILLLQPIGAMGVGLVVFIMKLSIWFKYSVEC